MTLHMTLRPSILVLLFLLLLTAPRSTFAAVLFVPDDHPTIQAAIDAASPLFEDTVRVRPGEYVENVVVDRRLRLESTDGSAVTTITAARDDLPTLTFESSIGELTGFTLRGGSIGLRLDFDVISLPTSDVRIVDSVDEFVQLPASTIEWTVPGLDLVPRPSGSGQRILVTTDTVRRSMTWPTPPAGFVYVIDEGAVVTVRSRNVATLTLGPGTIVKMSPQANLIFSRYLNETGRLEANGVIFTSLADDSAGGDSNGDGPSTGSPGDWGGIRMRESPSALTDCSIRFGGYGFAGQILLEDSSPEFTRCEFVGSSQAGLYCEGSSAPRVIDCSFRDNRDGIWAVSGGRPLVIDGCFEGNTQFGVRTTLYPDSGGSLSVLNAWWGDPSGPSGAFDGLGDAVGDHVLVQPWAQVPVCETATGVDGPIALSVGFRALPPRPNPFNPSTDLAFELPDPRRVDLEVFDARGRSVVELLAGETLAAGTHEIPWPGTDRAGRRVASGVYHYRVVAGADRAWGRLLLVK